MFEIELLAYPLRMASKKRKRRLKAGKEGV